MSTDGTRQVIEELAATEPRLRMVDNPSRITPGALNRAIVAATGTIIVRCDAHAILPPGYVSRAVAQLEATGAANVGGVQRAVGDGMAQRAVAMAMTSPIGVGDARYRYGGAAGASDTVYLGNFQRSAIEAAGLFDERMVRNQDYELNYRLRARGDTVWSIPILSSTTHRVDRYGHSPGSTSTTASASDACCGCTPTRCGGASWQHRCWWLGSPDRPYPSCSVPVPQHSSSQACTSWGWPPARSTRSSAATTLPPCCSPPRLRRCTSRGAPDFLPRPCGSRLRQTPSRSRGRHLPASDTPPARLVPPQGPQP